MTKAKYEIIIIYLQAILVLEGDHLKLTCASFGNPKPTISWNRLDGNAVPEGSWRGNIENLSFRCSYHIRITLIVFKPSFIICDIFIVIN